MIAILLATLAFPSLQERPAAHAELTRALQARLDALVADGKPPGVSAGLVLDDGTELALAAGLADRAKKTPLTPHGRLCAGSTGKTFVAATVLQLIEADTIHLDDFAGDLLESPSWFERLPNADELTVELLLRHRTGLERHEFLPEFMGAVLADPDRTWKPEEITAYVLDHDALFPAGSAFAYSDTNYILLGMIVERVTGKPLYDEVRRRFLEPLALHDVVPQDGRQLPGLANGYAGARNPFGTPDEMLGADGRFILNPQFEWAGGGFITTGGDLARWARALYGGDVLQEKTRAAMLDGMDAKEIGRGIRYGLGAMVWPGEHGTSVGHAGFFPGYLTEMHYWPEHRIAVAVQVNTSEYAALDVPLGKLCDELLGVVLDGEPAAATRR